MHRNGDADRWEVSLMSVSIRGRVRVAGVGAACVVSLAAGLVLVFKLVTPESVTQLGTMELSGLLGLLVMPVVVGVCLRGTRGTGLLARVRTERSAAAAQLAHEPIRKIVVLAPDVRDRSGRRHRRRVHAKA